MKKALVVIKGYQVVVKEANDNERRSYELIK